MDSPGSAKNDKADLENLCLDNQVRVEMRLKQQCGFCSDNNVVKAIVNQDNGCCQPYVGAQTLKSLLKSAVPVNVSPAVPGREVIR